MKNKRKFTLIEKIAIAVLITAICTLIIFTVITINKSNKLKQIKEFNRSLTESAEKYIFDKKDEFFNFNNNGDITVITVSEMIDDGYLDKDIKNPTGKELTDYYIKATINKDKSYFFEVIG